MWWSTTSLLLVESYSHFLLTHVCLLRVAEPNCLIIRRVVRCDYSTYLQWLRLLMLDSACTAEPFQWLQQCSIAAHAVLWSAYSSAHRVCVLCYSCLYFHCGLTTVGHSLLQWTGTLSPFSRIAWNKSSQDQLGSENFGQPFKGRRSSLMRTCRKGKKDNVNFIHLSMYQSARKIITVGHRHFAG